MAWCTSISKLFIFCVICLRCLLLRRSSTSASFSACIVLLRLAGVVCINSDIRLVDLVVCLVPLTAVVIVLVCDCVLRYGALLLTVVLACACRLLPALLFLNIWLLSEKLCCAILAVLSTLGTAVRVTLVISGMSLVIFIVIRLFSFSNICAVCTLGNAWARLPCFYALLCGVGFSDLAMALLFFTASSVSFSNYCSSSAPSLLTMFLISFLQSAMVDITLSAWVMVGFVIFWWLNWAVLVNFSLLVVLTWHKCVR